jgi:EPS-associated MarR family transcriptional regulator
MPAPVSEEFRFKIMQLVEKNPAITQREVARELGMSIGKANFCLKALIDKGILKADSFRNSKNKRAYAYVLTPSGIDERARLTVNFLKRKLEEYEAIQKEIADLTEQAQHLRPAETAEQVVLSPGLTEATLPSDGSRTPT